MPSNKIKWSTDPFIKFTVSQDSFGNWEHAIVESIKNALDAKATRIDIAMPSRDYMVPLEEQQLVISDNGTGMSAEDLELGYCRFGRPRPGHRGTGKVAAFVVVERVRVETWQGDQRLDLEFKTLDVLQPQGGVEHVSDLVLSPSGRSDSGTRIVLKGFRQNKAPPSLQQVHHILLRHFHHVKYCQFYINEYQYYPEAHASPVETFEPQHIDGVGTVSGQILAAKMAIDSPGVVVYANGQTIYGPSLFGLEHRGYRGTSKKLSTSLLGRFEVQSEMPARDLVGAWSLTSQFKAFEKWISDLLEGVIDKHSASALDDRVDKWLRDPATSRYYARLGDDEKASAKRILRERAKRADSNQAAEMIIARLVCRSLALGALNTVFNVLEDSSDNEIENFSELFKGQTRWTLRQVTRAASLIKHHIEAVKELQSCVADYANHEPDIHVILEENPWIVADDFHSFRSNQQIRTALEKHFGIVTDDPLTNRRPDFFFMLGDAASGAANENSRYLIVELKGPHSPLRSEHQNQLQGYVRTFQRFMPGYVTAILLGTEIDQNDPPDLEVDSRGKWTYRAMTYHRLIERAYFRLGYMLEGVQETGAEEIVRQVVLREIEGLIDGQPRRQRPPRQRADAADGAPDGASSQAPAPADVPISGAAPPPTHQPQE